MSSKKIIPFTAQHVIYETTLPFEQVQARLYAEVNKDQSADVLSILRSVKSQEAFDSVVAKYTGNDFLYFSEIHHHILLQYADGVKHPTNVIYTIGNPKIAQAVLKHNAYAAYNIPPRILITEKPDRSGCIVYYQLASSVMGVPIGDVNQELKSTLESLDAKLDNLAKKITAAAA